MSALTCSTCSKVFYDKHNRERHEGLIDSLDGKYCCDQCTIKFANPGNLEYHLGAKHKTNPETKLDCGECGKNDETLRLHMIYMHLKVNKYECDKCDAKLAIY